MRSGDIQGEAVMYQYIQDNINYTDLLPIDYNIFQVGYDIKTPPDLSLEQLNSGVYSTRKIEPLTGNSEFYIKVYNPVDSALLDTRDESIEYQLMFDTYYTNIDKVVKYMEESGEPMNGIEINKLKENERYEDR